MKRDLKRLEKILEEDSKKNEKLSADSSDPAKKVPETNLDKPKNQKLERENSKGGAFKRELVEGISTVVPASARNRGTREVFQ